MHLTLSPWWARALVAAGAQRTETSDSMTVNFPTPGEPNDAQSPSQGAPTGHVGEQGLLFEGGPAARLEYVGYRSPTACAAAGITYRQLDYWASTGLVKPSLRATHGSRPTRLYSFRDILVLKVVKRLLDTGVSLQQIRVAITHLSSRSSDDLAQVFLMSDGVGVYECTSPDEVVDLLQGGQGVFGIALGRIWQEVDGILAELPAEEAEVPANTVADRRTHPDELAKRRGPKAS